MKNVLVINGVNLNLTGSREVEVYGSKTLTEINKQTKQYASENGINCTFVQSNVEGEIVSHIHTYKNYDGIIVNPGAYTHYSYAISDAIKSINIPVVEVHMSNIFAREEFRGTSVTGKNCVGVITGFLEESYCLAVLALKMKFNKIDNVSK